MFDAKEFLRLLQAAGWKTKLDDHMLVLLKKAQKPLLSTEYGDFLADYWGLPDATRDRFKAALAYLEREHAVFGGLPENEPTCRVKFDSFGGKKGGAMLNGPEQTRMRKSLAIATYWSRKAAWKARGGLTTTAEAALVRRWFGTSPLGEVIQGIFVMNKYLSTYTNTITFVDARNQSEKLLGVVRQDPIPHSTEKRDVYDVKSVVPMGAGDYAYVKTLPCQGTKNQSAHVGSGMRIYIGERGFHPSKTDIDGGLTVYHEINHKLLGTKDWAYKPDPCRQLATSTPAKALNCPDNWAFFVQALSAL